MIFFSILGMFEIFKNSLRSWQRDLYFFKNYYFTEKMLIIYEISLTPDKELIFSFKDYFYELNY